MDTRHRDCTIFLHKRVSLPAKPPFTAGEPEAAGWCSATLTILNFGNRLQKEVHGGAVDKSVGTEQARALIAVISTSARTQT